MRLFRYFVGMTTAVFALGLAVITPNTPVAASIDNTTQKCVEMWIELDGTGQYQFTVFPSEILFIPSAQVPIQNGTPDGTVSVFLWLPEDFSATLQTLAGTTAVTVSVKGDPFINFSLGNAGFRLVDGEEMMVECFRAFIDGRLNAFDKDQPIAIYRTAEGFAMWAIDPNDSDGLLDYTVTSAAVEAARAIAIETGEAQVVGEGTSGQFFALPDGTCQVNGTVRDGKLYEFHIDDC
ncbi:MAG: hypothetical protein ACOCXZ_03175 [Chloroflexota bacterium]